MKIQVISYKATVKYGDGHEYTYSPLNEPQALDAFDINIISLQTERLWRHAGYDNRSIDSINDFESIQKLLEGVKKAKVVICFPGNYEYQHYLHNGAYMYTSRIKDMLPNLKNYMGALIPKGHLYGLVYENSKTLCMGSMYESAFYFENVGSKDHVLTKCVGGEHCTTYKADENLIFTTLNLSNGRTDINGFLMEIGLLEVGTEQPAWIKEYKIFDDAVQEAIIREARDEIEKQKQKIETANGQLEKTLHYKSILFETGEALVKVVFEILEKILDYSLSDFVDEKKEDFKATFQDVTFIGEIKGITSNVKSENVSQVEVHCQAYSDSLCESGKSENIKGILIINPLRNRPVKERDAVHQNQIQLAIKYGILIVTTETLLLLFCTFWEGKITSGKIVELLKNKNGLLTQSDFLDLVATP